MKSSRPVIDLWANFLANEKLTPKRTGDAATLIRLCELLTAVGRPKVRPHSAKLDSRDMVCRVAMENGIDLTAFKRDGKLLMGRGLLDAWNRVYALQFGSNVGTMGVKESTRRDVKTKLSQRRTEE